MKRVISINFQGQVIAVMYHQFVYIFVSQVRLPLNGGFVS